MKCYTKHSWYELIGFRGVILQLELKNHLLMTKIKIKLK